MFLLFFRGFPFLPFSIDTILVVKNSPFEISTKSPVSISVIPWPKAAKLPVDGSYILKVPIPALLSLTHNPILYALSLDFIGVISVKHTSPFFIN